MAVHTAYKDIAFEFGTAISVPFKLYLIEEFQRLKEQEQAQIGWNAKRELSRINYRIHTDAIKHNLIPQEITPAQASRIYANEADVLNMALFGMTALDWRDKHPDLKGNIRDYASINELMPVEHGEPECGVHTRGHTPAGTAHPPEPHRHTADASSGRSDRRAQALEMIADIHIALLRNPHYSACP